MVVLERFANILNIDQRTMTQIDENTIRMNMHKDKEEKQDKDFYGSVSA